MGEYSWMPRFLSDYHTSKIVVIKSPYLQMPNVCLQVLIAFYILAYSLCYNLRFMGSEEVNADVDMGVFKPMNNWATCSNTDFDCNLDLGDANDLPYCSDNKAFGVVYKHGVKYERRVERCWESDVHISPASRILVPTMISFLYQTWNQSQGDWMNDDVKEYYMLNIESFVLRFRHAFVSPSGIKKSSVDMDGVLSSQGGSYRFSHGEQLAQHQKEQNTSDAWSHIPELDECGTDPSKAPDQSMSCSRTLWGNVISVKQLLNFCGITSLDKNREGMHGATYRQSGLGIRAHIAYHNLDNVWERFFLHGFSVSTLFSPPPFYTLTIESEPMAGDFVVKSDITHPTDRDGQIDLNRRMVRQQTGIQMSVSAGGTICLASGRQLLLSAVSAIALLSLAQILVEKCLVKIYRHTGGMQHVSAMFFSHKNQGSVSETQFREDLEKKKKDDPDAYQHLMHDDVVTDTVPSKNSSFFRVAPG